MPNSGHLDDANLIFKHAELMFEFKASITRVRDKTIKTRKVNAPLYRSIIPFVEEFKVEHNYKAERKSEQAKMGKSIYDAIQSGLERGKNKTGDDFVAPFLAWICYHDPVEGTKLYQFVKSYYEEVGKADEVQNLRFRAYECESGELQISSQTKSHIFNLDKLHAAVIDLSKNVADLRWWWKCVVGTSVLVGLLLGGPQLYQNFFGQKNAACGNIHRDLDKRTGRLSVPELKKLEQHCGEKIVAVFRSAAAGQYVIPKEQSKALEDQIESFKRSEIGGARYLADLYYSKAVSEMFFNRAAALESLESAIVFSPNFIEAKIVKDYLAVNFGIKHMQIPRDSFEQMLADSNDNSPLIEISRLSIPYKYKDMSGIDLNSTKGKEYLELLDKIQNLLLSSGEFYETSLAYAFAEDFHDTFDDDRYVQQLLQYSDNCENHTSRKAKAVCLRLIYNTGVLSLNSNQNSKDINGPKFQDVSQSLEDAGLILHQAQFIFSHAEEIYWRNTAGQSGGKNWRYQEGILRSALTVVRQGGDPYLEATILFHLGANVVGLHKQDQKEAYQLIRRASDIYKSVGIEKEYLRVASFNSWREAKYGDMQTAYNETKLALGSLNYTPITRLKTQLDLHYYANRLGRSEEAERLWDVIQPELNKRFSLLKTPNAYLEEINRLKYDGQYNIGLQVFERLEQRFSPLNLIARLRANTLFIDYAFHFWTDSRLKPDVEASSWVKSLPEKITTLHKENLALWDAIPLDERDAYAEVLYSEMANAWSNSQVVLSKNFEETFQIEKELFYKALGLQQKKMKIERASIEEVIAHSSQLIKDQKIDSTSKSYLGAVINHAKNYMHLYTNPIYFHNDQMHLIRTTMIGVYGAPSFDHLYTILSSAYDRDKSFGAPFYDAYYLQVLSVAMRNYDKSLEYSDDAIESFKRHMNSTIQINEDQFLVSLMFRARIFAETCQDTKAFEAVDLIHEMLPNRVGDEIRKVVVGFADTAHDNGCSFLNETGD